jgi:V8-like Glu-specific endopeptidase
MMGEDNSTGEEGPSRSEIPHRDREPLFVHTLDEFQKFETMLEQPEGVVTYGMILESQCGATDDSQDVEMYDGALGVSTAFVNNHEAPVGQLQWNDNLATIYDNPGNVSGVRWGSGTMISDDLFLTAGHCLDQTGGGWQRPRKNGTNDIIEPSEIATNMHVNFKYQYDPSGNLRPGQSFPVTALVEYRLGGLDFAIVRVGGNPGQTYGITEVSSVDPPVNEMVCIIGHPAGYPKRIEAGPVYGYHGDYMEYDDIDTLGGNSGSGMLRASDGSIVAVHTLGGCTTSGQGYNSGVRISSIRANSPTISALNGYTLNVNIVGNGSVSRSPDKSTYDHGDVVQLTASPGSNYRFDGWSGALSGDTNPDSLTMDSDKTVTAKFTNCMITGAVVGSMLVSQVNFLRMYRDEVVSKSVFRAFFDQILERYYQFSPSVVQKMNESSLYEKFVKYVVAYPFIFCAKGAVIIFQGIRGLELTLGINTRPNFNS